jgi:ATP-dependent helicase/nuclease subunit B
MYPISPSDNFLEKVAEIVQAHNKEHKKCIVLIPNKRSCRELQKILPKKVAFSSKLIPISDLFSFEDITLSLMALLKEKKANVPLNTLYELAESLCSLVEELTLNNVNLEQLNSRVPENLQKYWSHTIAIISLAMEDSEIKEKVNAVREKLELFLKTRDNIIVVGVREVNYYAKQIIKKAEESGVVIVDDLEYENPKSKNNVEFLEFNSIFEEGFGIAVAVEKAVAEGQSVLVVSLDQSLTDVIKSELKRWNIFADDSRGTLFSKTPEGILVSLIADMMERQYDIVSVVKVIKMSPIFLNAALKLELFFRQKQFMPQNFWTAFNLYPEKNADQDFSAFIEKLRAISLNSNGMKSFSEWFDICLELASVINPEGLDKLNEILSAFSEGSFLSLKISLNEFKVFLQNRVLSQPIRTATGYTPNVLILGAIEAQLLDADFIVVAGANEESWVKSSDKNDFWMTKSMINYFGMQSAEMKNKFLQDIFAKLIRKKNVLVTRSTLVEGICRQKYRYFEKIAESLKVKKAEWLERELFSIKKNCKQERRGVENPNPPANLRPKKFSASSLNLLIRNPYAFYAKEILKLKEIGHINEPKNVFGNYVHEVLAEFVKHSRNLKDLKKLREIASKTLKNKWLDPSNFGLRFFRLDKIWSFVVEHMNEKCSSYAEIRGDIDIRITENYEIKINCRADRIDVDESGGVSIVDYKTYAAPSGKQVMEGKEIQLPIEAIIAEREGFSRLKTTNVTGLYYWELRGAVEKGKITGIAAEQVETAKKNALNVITELIQKYNVLGEPYAVGDSDFRDYEKPYKHLARAVEN